MGTWSRTVGRGHHCLHYLPRDPHDSASGDQNILSQQPQKNQMTPSPTHQKIPCAIGLQMLPRLPSASRSSVRFITLGELDEFPAPNLNRVWEVWFISCSAPITWQQVKRRLEVCRTLTHTTSDSESSKAGEYLKKEKRYRWILLMSQMWKREEMC